MAYFLLPNHVVSKPSSIYILQRDKNTFSPQNFLFGRNEKAKEVNKRTEVYVTGNIEKA
jgi:hypothetical protein